MWRNILQWVKKAPSGYCNKVITIVGGFQIGVAFSTGGHMVRYAQGEEATISCTISIVADFCI